VYNPPDFREDRLPVLHAFIREHGLATLITLGPDGLVADHIPMEVHADDGPLGTLRGHVSRANPVWHRAAPEMEALAIFQGPQTYVSPAWYPTKQETGKVVPTWNYAVVHAHGPLRAIEDRAWLRALVERLTTRHEAERADPWHVTDAPEDFVESMLEGIVGLEIPIARLEGKWKVSQNRPAADRTGVVTGLRAAGGSVRAAMADLVDEAARPRRG
jgi:transcriptional regulator